MTSSLVATYTRRVCLPALLLLLATGNATALSLPKPDGPYPVGMQRFELTDPSRHGVVSRDPTEPRVLPGYVWYPAQRAAHDSDGTNNTTAPRPYLTPQEVQTQARAMARNFSYGANELDALDQVLTNSVEGAPPARGPAFPILIFNHGYDCYPAQNTALLERLASHGYIVISIAHPHDAADLKLADGTLLTTSHPAGNDPDYAAMRKTMSSAPTHDARTAVLPAYAQAFSRDHLGASFVAWRDDTLYTAHAIEAGQVPPALKPVLKSGNLKKLGFVGMSFGGATAAATCKLVKHCRVAINFDGGNNDPALFNTSVERPLLLMMSDWVHLPLPNRPSDPAFILNDYAYEPWSRAGLNPDVVRVRLEGIRHMGYTDLILLMPGPEREARFGTVSPEIAFEAISAASLAFLDQYLKNGPRKALDNAIRSNPVLLLHTPESVRHWAEKQAD